MWWDVGRGKAPRSVEPKRPRLARRMGQVDDVPPRLVTTCRGRFSGDVGRRKTARVVKPKRWPMRQTKRHVTVEDTLIAAYQAHLRGQDA